METIEYHLHDSASLTRKIEYLQDLFNFIGGMYVLNLFIFYCRRFLANICLATIYLMYRMIMMLMLIL